MAKPSGWGQFTDDHDTSGTNIIGTSQGIGGSGKTHLWLTAPDPIAYFLLDPGGLKGLLQNPLFAKKDIHVLDLSGKLDFGRVEHAERVERGLEVMDEFDEHWDIAIKKSRTIIIDKEDLLWESKRYAHDEVGSPRPLNFGELNLWYRALYTQAENAKVNLGMIRGVRETWGNIGKGKQGFTGIFAPRGHKEACELAQINLEHRWDDEQREFVTKILDKCRLGNAKKLLGKEIAGLDFPMLKALLFPHAEDDDE